MGQEPPQAAEGSETPALRQLSIKTISFSASVINDFYGSRSTVDSLSL